MNPAIVPAVWRLERGGEVLEERTWGEAGGPPVPHGLIFDLASVTKLFTTTAVLRLATLGRLSLDDELGPSTVRAALAHSTGFLPWFPFYTRRGEAFETIFDDLLRLHPPTGKTVYSDLNFMALGRRVAEVTGLPLYAALADLVFGPLGLTRTSYSPPRGPAAPTEKGNQIEKAMCAERGLVFDGWRPDDRAIEGTCNDGNAYYYFGEVAGHAGLFSDAGDVCALGRLYAQGGRWGGEAYLDPRLAAEACRDHGSGRGLGFQFGDLYPGGGFGHTGFTGTYVYVNPVQGLVACLLASRLRTAPAPNIDAERKALVNAAFARWGRRP